MQGAVDKGYFKRQKKVLLATDKAHALIAVLPPAIKSPGMTAAWEQELEKVASGSGNMSVFMKQISTWICQMVEQLKVAAPVLTKEGGGWLKPSRARSLLHTNASTAVERCRIKGKNGFSGAARTRARRRSQTTEETRKSRRRIVQTAQIAVARCVSGKEKPLAKQASKFWGCTAYPDCKGTMPFKKSDFMD
ncbi:hypothetical protein QM166_26335 [Klebsiella pneumoniae]|nr:hypothetical protein [Klebsiella pneumoniae]